MKVLVDPAIGHLREIGSRPSRRRWYYASDDHPALLLVADGDPLDRLLGQTRIALFDFDTTDSNIVLDQFPAAPEHWRDMQLVQCTLKHVRRLPDGAPVPLSEALKRQLK